MSWTGFLKQHGSSESQAVEYKTSLSETDDGLRTLCGMINTDAGRGKVIFGLRPNGSICGVERGNLDTAQRSLADKIRDTFDPPLSPSIEVEERCGKQLIILSAKRSPDVVHHEYRGVAHIREGTTTRRLSLSEKRALQKQRDRDQHNGPWRCDRCGSQVGVVATYVVTAQGMKKTYKCDCGGEYWPLL